MVREFKHLINRLRKKHPTLDLSIELKVCYWNHLDKPNAGYILYADPKLGDERLHHFSTRRELRDFVKEAVNS